MTKPTDAPVANGAMATLFNASCIAASYPKLLATLTGLALQFDVPAPGQADESARMGPTNLVVSGHHFFTDSTTPYFNLDTSALALGQGAFKKVLDAAAPASAPTGRQGEKAVKWLKLVANGQGTGNIQEVYRVETAGGSAPATCEGLAASFEVQYAAE